MKCKELQRQIAFQKNKFTLNVFGNVLDSYHLSSAYTTIHTQVYVIQFV
jgi:hypothetical protein